MAKLYFKVNSDWEEVVRLRDEIAKLKNELRGMDSMRSPDAFKALNAQLKSSTIQMDKLVTEAAKAGAVMEHDFKKKIFDASQSVNGFTEKIIAQKAVVKDIEADVKRLGEAYRVALKNRPLSASGKLSEYNAARKSLDEERAALFGLTQQQANAQLSVKKLRDEYTLYKDDVKGVVGTNNNMAISWKKALGVIGGVAALKALGSEIIRVRGEFQSADTAIKTLLGSKEKTDSLLKQVREYAKISPLEFSDVTAATQMMLGFNIEAEKVPRFISAIGDISMGEASKFNSLTLAFSQMSATGKLMGQDLNQMINAGFNPLQIIAEKTGKSIAILKDEMSKGAISTEVVQQAFIDATSAGGKFYQMSENASKTINGQISMMHDALDAAFNEIGEANESVIMSGIQATTALIQNYETIGRILLGVVEVYGVYRGALIINSIIEQGFTKAVWAKVTATKAATIAQAAYNKVLAMNPWVLAGMAVVSLGVAIWTLADHTSAAERAQERYNKRVEEANEKERTRKTKLEELVAELQNVNIAELRRLEILAILKDEYPVFFKYMFDEQSHIANLTKAWKAYNEEVAQNKVVANKQNMENIEKAINEKKRFLELSSMKLEDRQGAIKSSPDDKDIWKKYNARGIYYIKKDIKENENDLAQAQKDVSNDIFNQWQVDLKKRTTEQIKAELEEAQKIQEARKTIKSMIIPVTLGTMPGAYNDEEVGSRVSVMEQEIKLRAGEKSYAEDLKTAKNEWETAKKELEKIERDKDKFTTKQYEDAKKKKETAEKRYKDLGGIVNAISKSNSISDQTNKITDLEKKQAKDRVRQAEDLENQVTQSIIDAEIDGSKKIQMQRDLDNKKEIQNLERQKEDYKEAYVRAMKELFDAEEDLKAKKDPKYKKKTFDSTSVNVDTSKWDAIIKNTEEKQDKALYKIELQSMRAYLEEYGTFQQKKLAITEEYAEKIKKAQNEWEVKSLAKERDSKISGLETESIKTNIDWLAVFGEFGGMFNDMIKPALEEAKKYIGTGEFKNSDQASQKTLIDAINQMEKSLGGAGGLNFKKLGQDVQVYQNALRDLNYVKEEEISAINKLKKAQEDYEKAVKSGTEQEKESAKDALDNAQTNADAASSNVKTQTGIVDQSQQNVSSTATKLNASMSNVTEGLSKLASGGIKSAYDGLIQASKGMGGSMEKIANKLEDVPIIGWIVSIIDVLKDGLSNLVGGLLDAILNAVSGIISDVLSGDLSVTIGKSIASGVGNILNAVTYGGFNSWFNIGGNAKETAEKIARLTASNESLKTSIDGLTKEMEKNNGTKSLEYYQKAKEAQSRSNENYRQILNAQMGYSKAHHSNAYYWDLKDNSLNQVNKLLGTKLDDSWADFSRLTAEQMNEIRTNLPDIWSEMIDQGKYGDRFKDDWNNYADQAGKVDELTEKINENIAQISFDSLRDSFVDTLMDMDASAEDFADNFEEYLMRSMLNFSIGDMLDVDMKKWYNNWAETIGKQGGKLTEGQIEQYKREWDNIVQKGIDKRNELADLTGYTGNSSSSSSQSATKKGFETMSQDTGSELNGRFTALQMAGEEIKEQSIIQTGLLSSINEKISLLDLTNEDIPALISGIPNVADPTKEIIADSYRPQVSVVFPVGDMKILADKVSSLESIVNEMRAFQVSNNMETQEIREGVQVLAKNSPRVLANINEIRRDIGNKL